MKPDNNPHRYQRFCEFLESLITEARYSGFVTQLRALPKDRLYEDMRWHSLDELLADYPEAKAALEGFAFNNWDNEFGGFSAGNLKATYIPDENFVDGGHAFILFNLVASNLTHVCQVSEHEQFWKRTNS